MSKCFANSPAFLGHSRRAESNLRRLWSAKALKTEFKGNLPFQYFKYH